MSQTKLTEIIKAIADSYNYNFAQWQSGKIKNAISLIDGDLAERLNYANSDLLLRSIKQVLEQDITPYIVKCNYPVWVDYDDVIPEPKSNKLVISYLPPDNQEFEGCISSIREYANRINADFVLLTGLTQGSLLLEKFRVRKFVAAYDRTIYFDHSTIIQKDCPDLFGIVPENMVGIYDHLQDIPENSVPFFQYKKSRLRLLKADAFSRYPALTQTVIEPLEYESNQINTWYDFGVVVCSREHEGIWTPILFPFSGNENDDNKWMEITAHRDGYEIFRLPYAYNLEIILKHDMITYPKPSYVLRYNRKSVEKGIEYTWLYDNSIIGYKNKPELDMNDFSILCLGHCNEQFDSIMDRNYLTKINLNNIGSSLGNEYAESRIYDIDFDSLFTPDKKYVGLVTASWNRKYIGLNPIDQFHNWAAIRNLDQNHIICSSVESSAHFVWAMNNALKIDYDQSRDFLNSIGLEIVTKNIAVSNQIIANREIVKRLFDFYRNNDILNKIKDFVNKNIPEAKAFNDRKEGCLSEFVTAFWIANQDLKILPQEIRKADWYWNAV